MSAAGCCCVTVPCSPSFSCTQPRGKVDWTLVQNVQWDRTFTGTMTACCEWYDSPGCDDPGATGPVLDGDVTTTFQGGIRFEYAYTTAIDLPQAISVSSPPTQAELCSLAEWDESASTSCPTVVNQQDVTTDLTFETSYRFREGTGCYAGPYLDVGWNYRLTGTLEVEWVSEPDMDINGNLQTRTYGVGEHHSVSPTPCNGTLCIEDECVTDWLVKGTGQVRVRWVLNYEEWSGSNDFDRSGPPRLTDSYTTSWVTVDIFPEHRSLYGPMETCSYKVVPKQTLESSAELNHTNLQFAIITALDEGVTVIGLSGPAAGIYPNNSMSISGGGPNTGLTYFSNTEDFYSGVGDSMGDVNVNAEFNTPTYCQVYLNYRKPTSMKYERAIDFDATIQYDPCSVCGPFSSPNGVDSYELVTDSELTILFITPDAAC